LESTNALSANDARIEQALLKHGVILFAEPTPGARLAEKW
jgi:hypothetical protein